MSEEAVTEEIIEEEPVIEKDFNLAIVRLPSPTLAAGLSRGTHGRPDYMTFLQQHLSYTAVLRAIGLKIIKLPSLPDYPDAQFVEDVAVITPEVAVIARPGAAERLGEAAHIVDVLEEYRPLARIEEPGTLEGGDVLRIGRKVYIGISERTNEAGAHQLAELLGPFGYEVQSLVVEAGLHLKSDISYIGRNTLLLTETWANHPLFADYEKIIVPADEAYVANSLLVRNRILTPEGFTQTHTTLREAGFDILEIPASEPQKLDGGMSCLSLRLE